MGYKFIFSKIKAKTKVTACVQQTQSCWNALIPKGDGLVAKACPAKSRIIPNQCRKSKKAKGKRG